MVGVCVAGVGVGVFCLASGAVFVSGGRLSEGGIWELGSLTLSARSMIDSIGGGVFRTVCRRGTNERASEGERCFEGDMGSKVVVLGHANHADSSSARGF